MKKVYNWGILAPGKIAHKFAADLRLLDNAKLLAVGSRTQERAEAFAKAWDVPKAYASYEDLAQDPDVDIVYVASPHAFHKEHTMLCLNHGKAVLCEKAFALTYADAKEMVDCARSKGVFLMEAFWTCFHPSFQRVKELVASGELGEIKKLCSDFAFKARFDEQSRLFNLSLGGGSLLDIGIYPVFVALQLLGNPDQVAALADFSRTGAEQSVSVLFSYASGAMASLYSSFVVDTGIVTELFLEKGKISMHRRWHHASAITISYADGSEHVEEFPIEGEGYQFEAEELMRCLDAGKTESDRMPLCFTLEQMALLDRIRSEAGICFE